MILFITNAGIKRIGGFLFYFLILMTSCYSPKLDTEQIQKVKSNFTESELEYFSVLAFKNEIHSRRVKLSKWNKDIRIGLKGEYTSEDSNEVSKIVNELNNIINPISIKITSFEDSDLKIYFISYQEFNDFYKYASIGTYGFFIIKHNFLNEITNGVILINKNLTGIDRKSTIRNEISNSLGLINDSYKYPTSAFQQFKNKNITYSNIDKKVISLLYNYNLPTSMDEEYFKQSFLE